MGREGVTQFIPLMKSFPDVQGGIYSALQAFPGTNALQVVLMDSGGANIAAKVLKTNIKIFTGGTNPTDNAYVTKSTVFGFEDGTVNNRAFDMVNVEQDGFESAETVPYGVLTYSPNILFNGVGFDRQRNNEDFDIFLQQQFSASHSSAEFTNYNASKILIQLSLAILNSTSITMILQGKFQSSTSFSDIATTGAFTTTGLKSFSVGAGLPSLLTGNNQSENALVPKTYRIRFIHGGAGTDTYAAGAAILL